jgi:hypothetical protein
MNGAVTGGFVTSWARREVEVARNAMRNEPPRIAA